MSGMETIVKFGCLSDEHRWNANRYNFEWLPDLDEHDRDIIKLLDCLCDGEYSGQASATQLYNLILNERAKGMELDLVADWAEIFSYVNIIVYEETRHGFTLGTLNHYVNTGNFDHISNLSVREYGKRYMWCFEDRKYWDLYSYILAHLFAEIINVELYRDVVGQVHHPKLKELAGNIMTDEARHASAWTELIKNLIQSDSRHEERALASLDTGLVYHNAMVHETYFEGLNKMLPLFVPTGKKKNPNKPSAMELIVKKKYKILCELFGDKNPISQKDVRLNHMKYLSMATGETRASYDENSEYNIKFG